MNVNQVDKENSSEELIAREKIENSPFEVISMEGYHFGVMGDYRLTEKSNDKEEIKKKLETITWNRIIQVLMILNELNDVITKKTIENED